LIWEILATVSPVYLDEIISIALMGQVLLGISASARAMRTTLLREELLQKTAPLSKGMPSGILSGAREQGIMMPGLLQVH
jgi:hypothetical protein